MTIQSCPVCKSGNLHVHYSGSIRNSQFPNIVDGAVIDREPDAKTWDLLFTKYYSATETYFVTGVKQNFNVLAIDKSEVDVTSVTFEESEFSAEMNIIGSDWKNKKVIGSEFSKKIFFFERINEYSTTKTIQNITYR